MPYIPQKLQQQNPSSDEFDVLDWDEDEFPRISNVASATECTGLMPRPPLDEAEEEALLALSSNELPQQK